MIAQIIVLKWFSLATVPAMSTEFWHEVHMLNAIKDFNFSQQKCQNILSNKS